MIQLPEPGFPDWLENFRIPEEPGAAAYERVSPVCRALIKTAIAMAFGIFDQKSAIIRKLTDLTDSGLRVEDLTYPAAWSLIVFDSSFSAPARLLASVLAPILANVPGIAAICVNGQPSDSCLLTLDLCGATDIFCMNEQKTGELLRHMAPNASSGGVILLHAGNLRSVSDLAREKDILCYEETKAPKLLLASPDAFNRENLLFCHGFIPPASLSGKPDAIFTTHPENFSATDCRLLLTPGCEGFWSFPQISPSSFTISQISFRLL